MDKVVISKKTYNKSNKQCLKNINNNMVRLVNHKMLNTYNVKYYVKPNKKLCTGHIGFYAFYIIKNVIVNK